ncbi:hypothetical protein [Nocardioides dongxiaopingii]|uniref:hypothetical protein n=1 Tax=Nocardioides dongxiaopingii TaxID=2576036 RepID=UPI0010C76AD7|nr:hypothetical protein [Nocardioides dongxiaopingii]
MKPQLGVARLVTALALVVTLGAVALLTYVVLPRSDDPAPDEPGPSDAASAPTSTPTDEATSAPPSPTVGDWPARVQPFVDVVERERGLQFTETVPVVFLAPDRFRAQVTQDQGDLTREERAEARRDTAFFRALGLIGRDVDLFDEVQRLRGVGALGYYSSDDQRIRVRGTDLTPAVRATLVHELTHALQDQRFAIGETSEKLEEQESGSAESAYDALVEGDASRVETAYVQGLPQEEQDAWADDKAAETESFEEQSRDIPPVLNNLVGAPYVQGEQLLQLATALSADGDANAATDALFADPPTTEEHLLDPWTLLVDQDAGAVVDTPAPRLGAGEEELDSGTFGAFGWYLVLAQRLDPRTALEATDGWGGDAYVSYEDDGRSCVRVAYRGDTPDDVDQLADALATWVAPSPAARVERDGDGLLFTACEPDTDVPALEGQDLILQLPLTRTAITTQVVEQGGEPDLTRCYVEGIVDRLTVEQLVDPGQGESPEVAALVQEVLEGCGG